MTREETIAKINKLRQEFIESGQVPYALILGTEPYKALGGHTAEIEYEELVHDPYLELTGNGSIQWWDERYYEKAIETWMDMRGI